jgi:hypothetical protein
MASSDRPLGRMGRMLQDHEIQTIHRLNCDLNSWLNRQLDKTVNRLGRRGTRRNDVNAVHPIRRPARPDAVPLE